MRNCPAWVLSYMAAIKAGAIATLLNGWWQSEELEHALQLTEPKLILADAPRAERIAASLRHLHGRDDRHRTSGAEEAFADLLTAASADISLPEVTPDDDATILFTSGSTGEAKGAVSTHRAVTTGIYAYATSLMVLAGILESEGRPPLNPLKTLVVVPLFHVTGEVPVHAEQLRHLPRHGADAEVGRGGSVAADREGKDHLFRRRADDEPGADEPPRPGQLRPQHADRHRRRRGAAAGRPCRAAAPLPSLRRSPRSAMA